MYFIVSIIDETTIGGYRIPKDAACIANLYNATRDKRIFKNPDEFDPENFLDEEGKFVKNGSNIPFSLGPRNCLAEPLARISVFLFITAILQNYNLSEPPNTKSQYGTTRFAGEIFSPHQICATRRT
jgi:cytochrome P450